MKKVELLTEKELIILLQQDDMNALSGLYNMHVKQLKYFILKTAKSPSVTEDVLHDTFIKIWETRSQIYSDRPFKPYLYSIARNLLLNLLKRAQHETQIINEIIKHAVTSDRSTELRLAYNESNTLLYKAIERLPPRCREIFINCKINGLSHKQTAEKLGISESTVNNQMGKALRDIKYFLDIKNALIIISIWHQLKNF